MKKVFYLSICILIVSLILSCDRENKKRIEVKSFPETIVLKGEQIKEIQLQMPRAIRIIDSVLVIINSEGTHFFEYFNINNFELLGRYGNKGRGPGEFINITETGEFFKKSGNEVIISAYDWVRRRMNYINLYESLTNKSYLCNSETLPNDLLYVHRIIFNNDSLMGIIPDLDGGSRFFILDKKRKIINRIPFIPELLKGGILEKNKYNVYNTIGNCVSDREKYFIASPRGNGQMDFFDFHGNYLKTVHLLENEHLKEAGNAEDVNSINGFNIFASEIQIVDNEIYWLLTAVRIPSFEAVRETRIYVFDLEGNPKREYILDKELHHFTIDTNNKRFLGFPTMGIHSYELFSFYYEN